MQSAVDELLHGSWLWKRLRRLSCCKGTGKLLVRFEELLMALHMLTTVMVAASTITDPSRRHTVWIFIHRQQGTRSLELQLCARCLGLRLRSGWNGMVLGGRGVRTTMNERSRQTESLNHPSNQLHNPKFIYFVGGCNIVPCRAKTSHQACREHQVCA